MNKPVMTAFPAIWAQVKRVLTHMSGFEHKPLKKLTRYEKSQFRKAALLHGMKK